MFLPLQAEESLLFTSVISISFQSSIKTSLVPLIQVNHQLINQSFNHPVFSRSSIVLAQSFHLQAF